MKILYPALFFLLWIPLEILGQQKSPPDFGSLKRQFRNVSLMETYDEVMKKLKADPLVLVDPTSDFGDLDEEEMDLIKAQVSPYIRHIYYQFMDRQLFLIGIFFDKDRFSYLELYRNLKEKYGQPAVFNSRNIIWEDEKTRIILDNLPSVKYIDRKSFEKIQQKKEAKAQIEKDIVKEKILEDL